MFSRRHAPRLLSMWNKPAFVILFALALSVFPLVGFGAASGDVPDASGPASQSGGNSFSWISFFYSFLLSAAAILAVFMLVLAGVEMMTAVEKWRTDAKERIWNAIIGLLLAALSFLILKTIDPKFLDLKITPVEVTGPPGSTIPPGSERGWCKATTGFCSMQSPAACAAIGTFFGANKPNDCRNP